MKYYPIEDTKKLTKEDVKSLGVDIKDVTVWGKKVCTLSDINGDVNVMTKRKVSGYTQYDPSLNSKKNTIYEYRKPLKGEWFLSGAVPAAYRAARDLSISYYIVELVLVKTITITTQMEVIL